MTILPKVIYAFNAIHIKIYTQFFTDLERIKLSLRWKNKNPGYLKQSQTIKELLEVSPFLISSSSTKL